MSAGHVSPATAPTVHRPGRWFAVALLGFLVAIAAFLVGQTEFVIMHTGLWLLIGLLVFGGLGAVVVGLFAGCVAAIRR